MPTNSYDVIVLGDDFSGVVAATLCAARGLRVLLAHTRGDPDSYQIGPHKLPTRALPFAGMSSPAVRRVVDELNFTHLLKRRLRDAEPSFQFIGPDARIDVTPDDDELELECKRDLNEADTAAVSAACGAARELSELLEPVLGQAIAFPPDKFFDRREIARYEEPLASAAAAVEAAVEPSPLAHTLLELPAALGTRADPTALSAAASARAFDLWRRGTASLPGGWSGLRSIFLDKFASHGGEVREVTAEALTMSWGKVTGVMLQDREELGAEQIIAALPLDELIDLTAKVPKKMTQSAAMVSPAAYRYTLNLVVAEAGIPEGIGQTALLVGDPGDPLVGDNAVAVYLDEPDDEARVRVTVEAVCPAPARGQSLEDALADLRIRLRERIEQIMPFSSEHVLVAHSPNETADPEGTDARVSLAEPVPPTPLWRVDGDAETVLDLAVVPYHPGVKRLIVASSQVIPGMGLEGALEVGWCAALAACAGLKKKDYLKDEVIAGTR